jgi:hypothetical protein
MDPFPKNASDLNTFYPLMLFSGKTSSLKFGKITQVLIVRRSDWRIFSVQTASYVNA